MGAFLGSLTALCIGLSDLFGRRITVASNSVAASAVMQAVAVVVVAISLLFVAGELIWVEMLLGAISGLCMGAGLACYYRGMTESSSAVVAPVVATMSAVVPYAYTIVTGATPSVLALSGAMLAFVGLVMVTLGDRAPERMRVGLAWALMSGLGFAMAQTVLVETTTDSGSWPGIPQRLAALSLMLVVARVIDTPVVPPRRLWRPALLAGGFAGLATVFFLVAVARDAQPAVVTASMYPAVTVVIGWLFFRDHVARVQFFGIGAVLVGISAVVAP